jgi:hypothetical protein
MRYAYARDTHPCVPSRRRASMPGGFLLLTFSSHAVCLLAQCTLRPSAVVRNCLFNYYSLNMKIFINENSYDNFTLIILVLAIIYVILSFTPVESIKWIISYGPDIHIYIFSGAAIYIIKFTFEQLSKYLSYKSGILARIFEFIFGVVLIFTIDFVPFIIDSKNNPFPVLNKIQMFLFTILFLLLFIIHPIMKLYYMIQFKKIDMMHEVGMKLIEEEYKRELGKIENEYSE